MLVNTPGAELTKVAGFPGIAKALHGDLGPGSAAGDGGRRHAGLAERRT